RRREFVSDRVLVILRKDVVIRRGQESFLGIEALGKLGYRHVALPFVATAARYREQALVRFAHRSQRGRHPADVADSIGIDKVEAGNLPGRQGLEKLLAIRTAVQAQRGKISSPARLTARPLERIGPPRGRILVDDRPMARETQLHAPRLGFALDAD